MSEFPLLSDQEIEEMPVFGSLADALDDPDNAYTLELMGEVFSTDELEDALLQLPRIQVLVINGNDQLDAIPAGIAYLKNLQYLEVQDCPLSSIAEEIGECGLLSGLMLSNVRPLASLPESMGRLTKMEFAEISATDISTLPDSFANWKNLTELNLINDRIHVLPAAIGGMTALVNLRTYGNYVMYVDDFILGLKNLEAFDHGTLQFRGTTEEEVKSAIPKLVMKQVTTSEPVFYG